MSRLIHIALFMLDWFLIVFFIFQAMKVVNIVKTREEFDYESLCRKLEYQVDYLTAEMERQKKNQETEKAQMEERLTVCEMSLMEAKKNHSVKYEVIFLSLSTSLVIFICCIRRGLKITNATTVITQISFIGISLLGLTKLFISPIVIF